MFQTENRKKFVGAILVGVLLLSSAGAAEPVKVFLLGGQSNMDGRAPTSGLPTELQSPQDDVLFFYKGNSALTTLRSGSGQNFGPEVTFGRTIADAGTGQSFALIKYAAGGTSLDADWDPATGATYTAFRTTVTNGCLALTAAGHDYEIVGMLWTQGERDAVIARTTAQYKTDLKQFIADVRSRYGAGLRFFISRLSSGQTSLAAANLAQIRAAQEQVAADDPKVWIVNADAFGIKTDHLHFDAAGQMSLGEAFGRAVLGASKAIAASAIRHLVSGVEVDLDGLNVGSNYILYRDTGLPFGVAKVLVDSVTAGGSSATLGDTNPPTDRAFYQATFANMQ